MNRSRRLSLLCLLVLLASSCHLVADKVSHDILDSFKKVDSSIMSANKLITDREKLEYYHLHILARKDANTSSVATARTIYTSVTRAVSLMETTKQTLLSLDSGGEDTHVAEHLLIGRPLADSLQAALLIVYSRCQSALSDSANKSELDGALHNIQKVLIQPGWQKEYFKGTATVGALTVLSAWQSDCRKAGALVLEGVDRRL